MTADKEHWVVDVGSADVALLEVPADAQRERLFEISCEFVVAAEAAGDAWHGLRVLADGALQWARRVSTHGAGPDTLEVSFRRSVPVGQPLRLSAQSEVHRARRVRLAIAAEEQ
jgi:hypothetical protein